MVKRGDVYWIDLGKPEKRGVQAKRRPSIIVQGDKANKSSPVTIIVVSTTNVENKYPSDVIVEKESSCLESPSKIMCNQIFTIPKSDLEGKMGELSEEVMEKINNALKESLDLP